MSLQKNKYDQTVVIRNSSSSSLRLIIEPWADEVFIDAERVFKVHGRYATGTVQFELEYMRDCLIIFGQHGALVAIEVDNEILLTGSNGIRAL